MAQDATNTSGTTTGNQKIGNVTVYAGNLCQSSTTHETELLPVSGTSEKYDDRFDDPTYY